jgi:BirA family biotin operon repressor/biotin-[acetyl-CoA-carboxylase] ligase
LICGLAVCKVLEKHGLIAEVKWPNDVMVQQKKVCGILIEASESAVIAGIGINVNVSSFPDVLKPIATSMLIECGKNFDRQEILSEIQQSLMRHLLRVDNDFTSIIQELRERCYLTGKSVRMLVANQERQGTVLGIGKNGELVIDHTGRQECYLQADEIRIVS